MRNRLGKVSVRTVAAFFTLAVPALVAADPPSAGTPAVDFVRDVQPIFQQNCYKCHGPEQQKALLRFDSKRSVEQGGQSGAIVLPGKADDSRLIHRVLGLDGDDRMPLKSPPLDDRQIAILKTWIKQGADFPESASVKDAPIRRHWAYVNPVRPAVPDVKDAGWCKTPIDCFIEARLEKEGIDHSPPADRATLIRRLSLDLVGLPPTIQQVDDFANDASPDAYDKVVDRLLASPHYGERWAMPWLDLARYADSEGYERDPLRSMWPYRDWVINALNRNMPFDQFTIEQLAGDLLPDATEEQKIATGFHRNTQINREAGSDQGEYFYYALVDRVNTTATVWLGSTLACSQCHNHKYDPFTQKDYYRLMAFFNGTADEARQVGGSEIEDISAKLPVESPQAGELRKQLADAQAKLNETTPERLAAQKAWEASARRAIDWTPLDIKEVKAEGAALTVQPDGSVLSSGALPATDTYTIVAHSPLAKVTGVRLDVLPDDQFPAHGPGRAPNGNFVLSHVSIRAGPAGSADGGEAVEIAAASADFNQTDWTIDASITEKAQPKAGWAILPETGKPHFAVFEMKKGVAVEGGATFTIRFEHKSEAAQHLIGRFRLSVTDAARPVGVQKIPDNLKTLLAIADDQRTQQQADEIGRYYRSIAPELAPIRARVADLEKQVRESVSTTLVMRELPEPRKTHVHVRGAYLTEGEEVEPAVPAILSPGGAAVDPAGHRPNRLDLARWLVGADNPLTARVIINRVWEQYFGTGIVKTSEDFGTQGDPPSNPELLDWLACEFRDSHWDLKHMHRLIVTSAAYQQSSDVTPESQEKDPADRLLSRAPRFRLQAELIRDQALAAGGLLSEKMGGKPVFPLQPDGIWKNPYSGDRWETSPGEDRYRRGIYTFLRRSTPYPQFVAFDMTSHEAICPRRSRTNTPLQALTALNDPALVQPAASLARRAMKQSAGDADRVVFIFRSVLARPPEAAERDRLIALYADLLKTYTADAAAAQKMADSGLGDLPKDAPAPELAAWTVVANTVLNLDETLTKG